MSGGKKGLFGSFGDLFVETVPDKPGGAPPVPVAAPPSAAPVAAPAWIPPAGLPGFSVPSIQADPNALAKLEAKLQAATPPVYAAFIKQFADLESVIPDEGMRFRTALKVSGASVEQLSGAIDQLIQTMAAALEEFNQKFKTNREQAEATVKSQADADLKLISTCQEQIKSIQAQMLTLQTKVDTDAAQARANATRYDGIKQGFMAAYEQIVARLTIQKKNISART